MCTRNKAIASFEITLPECDICNIQFKNNATKEELKRYKLDCQCKDTEYHKECIMNRMKKDASCPFCRT